MFSSESLCVSMCDLTFSFMSKDDLNEFMPISLAA